LPHIATLIADTAVTIETHLAKQAKLSNLKYSVFAENQAESEFKSKLELSIRKNTSSEGLITPHQGSTQTKTLQQRIEATFDKMTRVLEIPHQCIIIASVYVNRAVARMAENQFFLSTLIAEK
jgi:hypothetical protein